MESNNSHVSGKDGKKHPMIIQTTNIWISKQLYNMKMVNYTHIELVCHSNDCPSLLRWKSLPGTKALKVLQCQTIQQTQGWCQHHLLLKLWTVEFHSCFFLFNCFQGCDTSITILTMFWQNDHLMVIRSTWSNLQPLDGLIPYCSIHWKKTDN